MRSHFAPLPPSGLVQRQLACEPIILVAASDYLAAREPLERPEQLGRHDGLVNAPSASRWRLHGPADERVEGNPKVVMAANESTVLLGAARAGLGVACLPESLCRAALLTGELVRVLPEWNAGIVTTTLLMPHRRGQLPGVRATVDFLVECFGH